MTDQLNDELQNNELVVNQASKEYASAVDLASLKAEVVSPVFKDFKNGQLKIISFFAKKARGLMARYLIDNNAQSTANLLSFAEEGYAYSAEHTTNPAEPVFIRQRFFFFLIRGLRTPKLPFTILPRRVFLSPLPMGYDLVF